MSTNETFTAEYPKGPRCDERRRRPSYLRINHDSAFNGWLVESKAKRWVKALDRSFRSKYSRHVGAKQLAKASA